MSIMIIIMIIIIIIMIMIIITYGFQDTIFVLNTTDELKSKYTR